MFKAVVAKLSLIATGYNEMKNFKLTKEEEKLVKDAVEEVAIKGKTSYFSELIFMLTLLIDGKEINELLTSLINKLDNIASLLNTIRREKLEERFVDEYAFFNRDRYFDNNGRCTVLEELRCINGFAKMSGETDSAKKVMYEDAVLLLGIEGHDEKDLEEYVDSFLDKTKMRVSDKGKPDTGFRNFIAIHDIVQHDCQNFFNIKYIINDLNMYIVIERLSKKTHFQSVFGSNLITAKRSIGVTRKVRGGTDPTARLLSFGTYLHCPFDLEFLLLFLWHRRI